MTAPVLITFAVVLFFVGIMGASLYLSARSAERAKKEMVCLLFNSQDLFLKAQREMEESGIVFSNMLWAPSQTAYNVIGAAQRTPKEIWISRADWEKFRGVFERSFITEVFDDHVLVSRTKS